MYVTNCKSTTIFLYLNRTNQFNINLMKKLCVLFVALSMFFTNAQGVLVISEVETTDISAFEVTLNQWISTVKKVMEIEDAKMRVHQIDGSRELIVTRWFESMKDMVDNMEMERAKNEEIGAILSSSPEPEEGSWNRFVSNTDFKGSSVWEFVPEASTLPASVEGMSKEQKDEMLYRRVQYFSVDLMQGDAFEAWWKKANEADAKLGIKYHFAMFRSVFGGNDADYMIILLDKSRFDYYNNWEERMNKRMASEEFKTMMANSDASKWSAIKESNWNRLISMTH